MAVGATIKVDVDQSAVDEALAKAQKINDAITNSHKTPFGTNQVIASVGAGATFLFSCALVWPLERLTGPEWIAFAQIFTPAAIGIVLGASAGIKIAQALKGQSA